MTKETVTSSDLQRNIGTHLEGALRGKSVIITRRGRPVAVLAPLPPETPKEKEEIANE